MEQVKLITVSAPWKRALLLLPAALALMCAWYGLRWAAGGTLAEYAQDTETAEAAARLAPYSPLAYLRAARLRRISFLPEELPKALSEYERAAALAPNDYLIWLELGRARAASGDEEGGIRALRHAVELAPHYAQPRWLLGNALLRAGRAEEAFVELRRATEADPSLRPQVFNLAERFFGGEMTRVLDAVGRTPEARADLIGVLVGRGQLESALAVWTGFGTEERRRAAAAGGQLARALYTQKQYRRAAQVLADTGAIVELGQVANGSFESDIGPAGRDIFGWQVQPPPAGLQVVVDARRARSGSRSLRLIFNASTQIDLNNVSQFLTVKPGARWRLSFFVRTEELRSAATATVQVLDAATSAVIASSQPAPTGTSEWRQETLEFTAGPNTEGLVLRLARAACADGVCPIFGRIWYDDFNLERLAGRAAAR
jgi:tetratricopeptide (TPR) repeat protein